MGIIYHREHFEKREYLGHTINFKTRKHFKDKKSHYVSEDEWTIFENTHEAIIDQQTFDLAQKIRSNVRRYQTAGAKQLPSQDCSIVPIVAARCMSTAPTMERGFPNIPVPIIPKFRVGHYATQHRINESAVLTLVSDTLRAIAEYSKMTGRNLFTPFRKRRLPNRVPI